MSFKEKYLIVSMMLTPLACWVAAMCVPGGLIWLIYDKVARPSFPNLVDVSGWWIGTPFIIAIVVAVNGLFAIASTDD